MKSKWVREPDGSDCDHDGDYYPLLASNLSEKSTLSSDEEEEDSDCWNGGRKSPGLTCKLEKQVGEGT